jgi:hypothetical protein
MQGTERPTQRLTHIAAEHRDLGRRARQLFQLVRRPIEESALPTVIAELATHLRDLSELMKHHIAQETAGGYLEEAVARVPRLAGAADAIERQHPDLLRDVAALVDLSDRATPSLDIWKQIGGAVAQFAGKLLAHETEESRILQQGFNEDPALFDLEKNR